MVMLLSTLLVHAQTAAWVPCVGLGTPEGTECTTRLVPEDYGALGETGSVQLSVARLPARRTATRHLWITADHPGDSAYAALNRWADWSERPDDLAIYAVDHRGVGANRIVCPAEEAPEGPEGSAIANREILPCGEYLAASGVGLAFIDTTQAAGDLMEISEQLKGDGVDVHLLGRGYGAFLVQRALVLSGRPEGVILDGPWPDSASWSHHDVGIDTIARLVLDRCADDTDCVEFLPDADTAFVDGLLSRCDALGSRPDAQRRLASLAHGAPALRDALPAALVRLERCDRHDIDALEHLAAALDAQTVHPGTAPALELHLAFAELWRDDAPDDAAFLASTGRSAALDAVAEDWPLPFAPSAARYPDHPRPVLLLHPGAAALTERSIAERRYDDVMHHHVEVPEAIGHVTDTPCGRELLLAFLDDPAEAPGPCATPPTMDFLGDPVLDEALFGTDDRWGGRRCGCASSPEAPAWAVLALLVLGARRRRATR